jgi:hypothetical protein
MERAMSAADDLRKRFTTALDLDAIALDDDSQLDDDTREAVAAALIASGIASELIARIHDQPIALDGDPVELLRTLDDALARSSTARDALDARSLSIIRASILATTIALERERGR